MQEAKPDKYETFQQEYPAGGANYDGEDGKETFCKLLANMTKKTNIKAIDGETTIWHINWAEVAWPSREEICTKDGTRLFFRTFITDAIGQVEVWMNEASALSVASQVDKAVFLTTHAQGKQTFPPAAAVKIVRTMREEFSFVQRRFTA